MTKDTEISKNDVFDDMFEEDDSSKTKKENPLAVLKELFTLKNIETKTELTEKQIIAINSKRMIARMLDWKRLDESLDNYMFLMVSKDRKGRAEFIDGFKAEREKDLGNQKMGIFSSLKDRLGFT